MSKQKFAAIIPAAGFSSRMGVFKPLLPIGQNLAIEKIINCFKQAGVTDIRVVVGFKRELLIPVLENLRVQIIINHNFQEEMYTSVQAGVRTLEDSVNAFFICPADYPLILCDTVTRLVSTYKDKSATVIYPTYNDKRGHPVLIGSSMRNLIMNNNPEGGLKTLLRKHARLFKEIPVDDPGININMNTLSDYQNVVGACSSFRTIDRNKEIKT
jgi:molybdenum cofactor cytidylyltransferase